MITWYVETDNKGFKRIRRYATEYEELAQTVQRALMTDKYYWDIYTWNYGSTLKDLIGSKQLLFIQGAIKQDCVRALEFEKRVTRSK